MPACSTQWQTGERGLQAGPRERRQAQDSKGLQSFGGVVGRSPAQVWTESISEAVPPARAGSKGGLKGGLPPSQVLKCSR